MKRMITLDVLRGFALLGIIFINIEQMVYVNRDYSPIDLLLSNVSNMAIIHRFFVIFSFLFGVGFYIFTSRAKAKGHRPIKLFVRRLLILLIFGAIHHIFQPGESLLVYAIIGFLLLPFHRATPRVVLSFGLVFTLAGCWLGFPVLVLGMFLLGHWSGQIGLFEDPEHYRRGVRRIQVISLVLIFPMYFVQELILNETGYVDVALAVGGLPVSVFYVTTIILLIQRSSAQRLLTPLANMGRMALTNYLLQTVIILTIAHSLNWFGTVHRSTLYLMAVIILMGQMIGSTLWLRHFKMGPVEYIWRVGTYWRVKL
ncbi:DUF418 domain-containing protein [Paenibacillus macquariensis]|uniref:Uncharacterized membrane protein YeiB n=1 Tax=Paenibacillus macquariensis TaxID=948756 RepID=A0ABY1KD03_9BACL|nr:DUF418 domain-containing protein [Paenibacillus macquariensis]MEC0093195.1 DUF418 domain-containing protein [Paenibacillus macquariensis]OAB35060.1 hypothetical protein PMSM_10770 [Paenibacillus macquariensis subsp. macquariensis]SIR62661.1 Uncharacterized membrane protein YeiB [Paenibacillus macquariensis]